MDGFKNTTKTNYDTASGRKFARGGMPSNMGGQAPAMQSAPMPSRMGGGTQAPAMQSASMPAGRAQTPPATGNSTGMDPAKAMAQMQARNARMGPVGRAKGGVMKKGNGGGVFNEKGKRATWDEVAAEGRRMEGRKPPVEGISTRPTDSSGRRMTNKELGMTPGGVDTAKKKGVPAHSSKPMIRRSKGGLTAMPKGKC